ncbi:carbohydrate ABC transporter permease [Deinococcus peraridilitoris]|uniref:ABC-type sugar transport system, permease component n=1 Tax=Deinococcus peraridilitoris (strain DSM 19664 / LMG 22246 / CIP 109416 / KR-200) TaxID=937777 RepID=L0A4S5_DEIPD|nr:carbohydrate ABC transporter permease [Deinococcus peraridilitoris]AFZ68020.1 ABC-type sugar transport system, permease component [Deinococcus peraridilitoris DSM 19664]
MLRRRLWVSQLASHAFLLLYCALALFPIVLLIMNSFKNQLTIFGAPFALPTPETFTLEGYRTLAEGANFGRYVLNSVIVTVTSLGLILISGAMAAFALSEYRFRLNTFLGLYLALGIMVPIRLGTVGILNLAVELHLVNTLWALILVYTAQGLPLAVFVLTSFMRQLPRDLKEAARLDGASEYRVFSLILPLIRPALGAVMAISLIPVWNDLWFPLILAPGESTKTIVLGASVFLGQFVNDYNAVLAALSIAIVPAVVLYVLFSRQLVRGLTEGAIK